MIPGVQHRFSLPCTGEGGGCQNASRRWAPLPTVPFVLWLQPCSSFIPVYLLPDHGISCQCKLRGSFWPEPTTHLYFGMATLYIFVCVYMCIHSGFSFCYTNSSRHCQSRRMALKPYPGRAEECFSRSVQLTWVYCNVEGDEATRKQVMKTAAAKLRQDWTQARNAALCPSGPCIQASLSLQTCSTVKP